MLNHISRSITPRRLLGILIHGYSHPLCGNVSYILTLFPSVPEFPLPGVLRVVFISTEGAHKKPDFINAKMTIIMATNFYRETFYVTNIII